MSSVRERVPPQSSTCSCCHEDLGKWSQQGQLQRHQTLERQDRSLNQHLLRIILEFLHQFLQVSHLILNLNRTFFSFFLKSRYKMGRLSAAEGLCTLQRGKSECSDVATDWQSFYLLYLSHILFKLTFKVWGFLLNIGGQMHTPNPAAAQINGGIPASNKLKVLTWLRNWSQRIILGRS